MKINLDKELPMGKSHNYKKDSMEGAPEVIQKVLEIEGVKGVYHVADFLAIERNAKYDWREILPLVRKAFGQGEGAESDGSGQKIDEHFGEVKAQVQIFKGIPTQIKLTDGSEEKRYGLPEMFSKAVFEIQDPNDNYI